MWSKLAKKTPGDRSKGDDLSGATEQSPEFQGSRRTRSKPSTSKEAQRKTSSAPTNQSQPDDLTMASSETFFAAGNGGSGDQQPTKEQGKQGLSTSVKSVMGQPTERRKSSFIAALTGQSVEERAMGEVERRELERRR